MSTKRSQSIRFAAALALAFFAVVPAALSQQMLCALAAKHKIDLKGNNFLTDSFDSRSLWKSFFGQYDPDPYRCPHGDKGDVASNDGVVNTIGVGNAEIYGHVFTGAEGTVAINQGWVGPHPKGANGSYADGWILHTASFTFPKVDLPYATGLQLGGPADVVTMTVNINQNSTNSTSYPASPPWSGVVTNILSYNTNLNTAPSPAPPGLFTTTVMLTNSFAPWPNPPGMFPVTVSDKNTVEPAPGTYIGPVNRIGTWFYYQRITGYAWPVQAFVWPNYSFTWNLYSTNAVYTTNHYDHVIDVSGGKYYVADYDSLMKGSTLVTAQNAELVLPNGMTMSGSDQITIAPGGSLQMYCGGTSCTVGGNGILNQAGYAANFILECTDSVKTFNFNGNGTFIGVLVAPEATMTLNGGGTAQTDPVDFVGCVLMNSITLNGHFKFHYDEALSELPGSPPWITTQPQSRTLAVGQTTTFTVSATGSPPLVYRWQFNGADIPTATNASYSVTNAQMTDAGDYSAIVTNSSGSATSTLARLTVLVPVTILLQPEPLVILPGERATFNVSATGSPPLGYQWRFNGLEISGATISTYSVASAVTADAGSYDVVVTNSVGSVTSSVAVLTVNKAVATVNLGNLSQIYDGVAKPVAATTTPAGLTVSLTYDGSAAPPTNAGSYTVVGMVADANYLGSATNTLVISKAWATVTLGGLSQAHDGTPKCAAVATMPPGLLAILTYDGSANCPSAVASYTVVGTINDANYQGWATNTLVIQPVLPFFTQQPQSQSALAGSNVTFSVAAGGTPPLAYQWRKDAIIILDATNSSYTLSGVTTNAAGAFDVVVSNPYGSATSMVAVLAVVLPPSVVQQPVSQTVFVGSNATFTVLATGTAPLTYQWCRNGSNIGGAINPSLSLAGVTTNDSGNYTVILSNPYGSITSAVAVLRVDEAPMSRVFVVSTNGASGGSIVAPVMLTALGNENALGFSLTYDPTKLSFQSAQLGAAVASGSLFINPSFTNLGRLGIAVSQPSGVSFPAGTQEVVRVAFLAQPVTNTISATIAFADVPTGRQLVDAYANILPASYAAGTMTLTPVDYEADVSPRPNGDHQVTIADWVQVGRFVAGLDTVANDNEFLRADCAPRANLGNGNLTVTDWVQAGRYAVGLDPLTPVGGPTAAHLSGAGSVVAKGLEVKDGDPVRTLEVSRLSAHPGQNINVPIILHALGDENALGFSISFDPAIMDFSDATAGTGAVGATVNLNSAAAGDGQVGLVVALSPGDLFGAGSQQVVMLQFTIKPGAANPATIAFNDIPVFREVSDVVAKVLSTSYLDGQVAINPLPVLQIEQQGANAVLSWPASSGAFVLQSAETLSAASWDAVALDIATNGSTATVTVPATNAHSYFRLQGK